MSAPTPAPPHPPPSAVRGALEGRYVIFHAGRECGAERWRLESTAGGIVLTGEQVIGSPHPFPSRHEYRATLTPRGRVAGLEVVWTVGERVLRATHEAEAGRWHVRIEYGDERREQHGDYPDGCEVEYASHLFSAFVLARRDFAVGGEHEFPVLRIGPPWMAVSPERMRIRCAGAGEFLGPAGPVPAKRYVASLPPRPEDEGYAFWADEDGFVLESYEGLNPAHPWMRLVELRRG
jgi:hypothetical protein